VTVLKEDGTPSPLVKTLIAPPLSRMGILNDKELANQINKSPLRDKYGNKNITNNKPSNELDLFYKKLLVINEKEKIAEVKEKERDKISAKQALNKGGVEMLRRPTYTNMINGAIMPMSGMFTNMMSGINPNSIVSQQSIQFYYSKDGQQFGPVSEYQISNLILNGEINSFTYLWKSGMSEWALASSFAEFNSLIK